MNSWELAVTGYISNEGHTIPVANDGYFEKEIPITDVQDIYLYLGDAITIFSYPGDTIEIYFDNNNPKETLRIKGKNTNREKELALCMQIYNMYRQKYLDINRLRYDYTIKEEDILSKLTEYYDNKIETIKSFEKENGEIVFLKKFIDETYFQTILPIMGKKALLQKFHCEYPNEFSIWVTENSSDNAQNFPLNYERFRTNNYYRTFLEYYEYVSTPSLYSKNTPVKNDYYSALSCFNNENIRDWYITQKLDMAFTYNDFNETSFVYDEFKKICTNKNYINLLERKYQVALRTQPGNPAPEFELKDETGKIVKLSDLRGKFVYMDFWSMGCGPCISEFENSAPEFHAKYKDFDIVYVYINVADNEQNWKKGIEKFKLHGINLTAEGWNKHPTCQAYNVIGIPHYVLIDREGKIAKNDCDRPSIILMKKENSEFDRIVRGEK
jgi:peroxiredoxin